MLFWLFENLLVVDNQPLTNLNNLDFSPIIYIMLNRNHHFNIKTVTF